jgi:hypothetical protein
MLRPKKDRYKKRERDGIFVKKSVVKTDDYVGKQKTYTFGKHIKEVRKSKSKPTEENIKGGGSKKYKFVNNMIGTSDDWNLVSQKSKDKYFDKSKSKGRTRYGYGKDKNKPFITFSRDVRKDEDGKTITKDYSDNKFFGNKNKKAINVIRKENLKSAGTNITISKYNKKGRLIPKEVIYKPSLKEKLISVKGKIASGIKSLKKPKKVYGEGDELRNGGTFKSINKIAKGGTFKASKKVKSTPTKTSTSKNKKRK